MTAEELAGALEARRAGDQWVARCPAHDDRSPSLGIREGNGGRVLLRCYAGCTFDAVRDALLARNLEVGTATADRAPAERGRETVYPICDVTGRVVARHVRVDTADGKRVSWRGPAGERGLPEGVRSPDLPLYGTELLRDARADRPVIVCEGEKAADALRALGVVSLGTVTGAATIPGRASLEVLRGRQVFVWPDNDEPGRAHMARIVAALVGSGVRARTIQWADAGLSGDAADWIAAGGDRRALAELARTATAEDPARSLGVRPLHEGIREAMRRLDAFDAGDFSDLVQTGIQSLDRRLEGGMRAGEVTLLGAPAKGGKTTLVQQIVSSAAMGGPVLLVSPEMGLPALAEREVVRRSGSRKWDRRPWGHVPETLKEYARNAHGLAAARMVAEAMPIMVLDRTETTMADVEAAAAAIPGLRLVAIDYAQQVAGELDERKPRYMQVGEVATRSVVLAERLQIPVLVASQVNESKEGRGHRSYTFRETAILEHKAHTVLIFEIEWAEEALVRTVVSATVVCTRSRSTAAFRLPVRYDPALYRIRDAEAPDEPQQATIPVVG